jgi:porin
LASALCGVITLRASAQDTTAAPSPLSTAFSYTGVLQSNVAGGVRRGTVFGGAAAAQLTLELDRLVPWPGAQLFLFLLHTHGGAPTDLVGALQAVSGIEAPPGLRVEELWLQQNALSGRLSVLVGRYDTNTEFYRLQSSALFVHSSLGIGPEFAQSGVEGPSTFPYTAVGVRADYKPSADFVWRAAVLNGTPVDRPGGGARLFAGGDGALLMGEVAALDRADTTDVPRDRRFQIGRGVTRSYERKIALGVWHYTASFPDVADTLASGAPVRHRGSTGAYIVADQSLWKDSPDGGRVLMGFVQLGLGDSRANRVGKYVGGGLALAGPLSQRPQDQLGLAIAAAFLGSHYRRTSAVGARPVSAETTLELTYLAQIRAWLAVQPDLQYVIAPGGTRSRRNAVVPGVRVALTR